MSTGKLMKVTCYDPKNQIRLLCYADTVVWDTKPTPTLTALRFGGYPERVQGLADAIYGGATIEIEDGKETYTLKSLTRQYRRELSHAGVYAEATLIAEDDGQSAKQNSGEKDDSKPDAGKKDEDDDQIQQDLPPRNTYIFCTPGNRRELFDAVDQKTAVPMIPEYQDYVLTELQKRNILRPLQVKSLSHKLEAWLLRCEEKDKNIVAVMEDGLKSGAISIPGATVSLNPLDEISSITEYLNTFGVTVAERIKKLFVPLFDPATQSLSPEVLAINQYGRMFGWYSWGSLAFPALATLLPPLVFALGSGWLLGRLRPWLLYIWMVVPLLLAVLPLPDTLGLWNGNFFTDYPLTLTTLDPAFVLPGDVVVAQIVLLAAGVVLLVIHRVDPRKNK